MKDLFHNQSPLAARKFFSLVTEAQTREVDSAARASLFKAFDRAPSGHRWSGFLVWPAPLVFIYEFDYYISIFLNGKPNSLSRLYKLIPSPFKGFASSCQACQQNAQILVCNTFLVSQSLKGKYLNCQINHTSYDNLLVDNMQQVSYLNRHKERAVQCRNTKRPKGSVHVSYDIGAQAA